MGHLRLYRTAEQERQRTKTFETTLKITLEEKQKQKNKSRSVFNVILVIVEKRERNVKRNPYHVSSCHVAAGITGGRVLTAVSPIAVASLAGKSRINGYGWVAPVSTAARELNGGVE